MNSRIVRTIPLALVLLLLAVLPAWSAGRPANFPLDNCRDGAFSTEEDFKMLESEPYDGNPIISDGDLLSPDGQL